MIAELPFLIVVAFAAGLVDAIAGGGGLVQLPGLYVAFPERPPADVFGTNKGSSIAGTLVATIRFARAGVLPIRAAAPAALAALPASALGAYAMTRLDPGTLRPIVLALLVAVFVFTLRKPDLGAPEPASEAPPDLLRAVGIGAALGFYDGFFGPGTGTFLVFAFVRALHLDFLRATAAAKLVNLATNAAALVTFALHDHVILAAVVPMAAANIGGAVVGTRLALRDGAPIVRKVFVVVALGLMLRIAWDVVRSLG